MALRIMGLAFRDVWKELWTILIVQLLFLLGQLLIITGPPAIVALFFYGNRIARDELATEQDFLKAILHYWNPAWRWGGLNLLVVGLLAVDYYLTGKWVGNPDLASFMQGLYVALLLGWFLLQIFLLPFLFEQEQPLVGQAMRNSFVFVRRNWILVLVLASLLGITLMIGTLAFMLAFAFGAALIAFAANHAVMEDLAAS
ncbi:MAG TPA: hypothetical protein VJ785_12380 [Anaerolineales bacterium]|nr:hypothetical protein [Anaerolineales bacterium]